MGLAGMAKRVTSDGLMASAVERLRGRESGKLKTETLMGKKRKAKSLTSSPRFLRRPLKPGFSQINITLDSPQGLVVDSLFVAQSDHGITFGS
jgi:hypothetical protein